jgi:hypothetical protein
MSANMGQLTSQFAKHGHGYSSNYESAGLPIAKICGACNGKKIPGKSHPDSCSKELQRRYYENKAKENVQ